MANDWDPPVGLEPHVPVLFLDLNPDDLSVPRQLEFETSSFGDAFSEDLDYLATAGYNSILPKEHGGQFYSLPIIRDLDDCDAIGAVASWDSSIHDNPYMNRVTEGNERIYLILKATVIIWIIQNISISILRDVFEILRPFLSNFQGFLAHFEGCLVIYDNILPFSEIFDIFSEMLGNFERFLGNLDHFWAIFETFNDIADI